MTQRTFLTSAVLSAASGQLLCQPDLVFGLIHSLTGRRAWSFAQLADLFTDVQAELLLQFPWLADLVFPDLELSPDPRLERWTFLRDVAAGHGGTLAVTVREPLADSPAIFTLPRRVTLVRLAR